MTANRFSSRKMAENETPSQPPRRREPGGILMSYALEHLYRVAKRKLEAGRGKANATIDLSVEVMIIYYVFFCFCFFSAQSILK